MTKYILEFYEKNSRKPSKVEYGYLRWGDHPRFTDYEGCFDYRIARWNGKVIVRYACNGNLAAKTCERNQNLRWVKQGRKKR